MLRHWIPEEFTRNPGSWFIDSFFVNIGFLKIRISLEIVKFSLKNHPTLNERSP